MITFTKNEAIEMLYYLFESGFISHREHGPIHDIMWKLKVEMDQWYPGWKNEDLRRIVKEIRNEQQPRLF